VQRYFGVQEGTVTTEPADLPERPGVDVPNVDVTLELDDGRTAVVHAILIDSVQQAQGSADFRSRYEELSAKADFIAYNGHSGLGANIRALGRMGQWEPGQYSIVLMNGCDTFAYVDSALWDARAAVNPDDETGTKYLDLVMNAMPALFIEMSESTMAMIRGMLQQDDPQTYEAIFREVDRGQSILVAGEEDNTFTPGDSADD
jgi:hypothetical protein